MRCERTLPVWRAGSVPREDTDPLPTIGTIDLEGADGSAAGVAVLLVGVSFVGMVYRFSFEVCFFLQLCFAKLLVSVS